MTDSDQENNQPSFNPSSIPSSSQDVPASSPLAPAIRDAPSIRRSTKPTKPPTITPRRFSRFFNPHLTRSTSSAGRQLRDITRNALNRGPGVGLEEDEFPEARPKKKRKSSPLIEDPVESASAVCPSSPLRSSPCPRRSLEEEVATPEESEVECQEELEDLPRPKCIQRSRARGLVVSSVPDWRTQTSRFYSRPEDQHHFPQSGVPFCTAACNTNSLVAIGDEDGWVRILESAEGQEPPFSRSYVSFKPHLHAVMDLAFSEDDKMIVTASGDQTALVADMPTQTTIYKLNDHTSSVKQVAFQPGNDNMIATCSRDGTVGLWDLRCSNNTPASVHFAPPMDSAQPGIAEPRLAHRVSSITGWYCHEQQSASKSQPSTPTSRPPPSVTSLAFLPQRPYHFLTVTDTQSSIYVWDVRHKQTSTRRGASRPPLPVSRTLPLASHTANRHFGISSLALGSDNSRLYSLCKDSTVYAYSTEHVVLGQIRDDAHASKWSRSSVPTNTKTPEGAGPLYGFRHDGFRPTTFYVRAAVRKTQRGEHSELLAVGSGEGSPVVFPTDERFLQHRWTGDVSSAMQAGTLPGHAQHGPSTRARVSSAGTPRTPTAGKRLKDTVPVFDCGTPLVRGHVREVSGVAWTRDGELVSIGDDYVGRVWREREEGRARDLRQGGEGEGRRYMWGWAEVEKELDEEDG
ncbi:MAG: hypothetical protein M1831_004300 [Alyxoria varia]|nr:MAG: hypothetical protein M1831_004300 [Alyxoria varia]